MIDRFVRFTLQWTAIPLVLMVAILAITVEPRRFDASLETPAPRPSVQVIPSGAGSDAEADLAPRTGAPDTSRGGVSGSVALPAVHPSGAPRQQLAGRGGKPDTTPQPSPRLRTPVPAVGVSVTAAPTRRPLVVRVTGNSVSGVASWFCLSGRSACTAGYGPGCLCAAAGPELRAALGPSWRGSVVTVSTGRVSVPIRLVDWCACPARLLDLYAYPFSMLGPLSAGLMDVRVSW